MSVLKPRTIQTPPGAPSRSAWDAAAPHLPKQLALGPASTLPERIDMKRWKDHGRRTPPASPTEQAAKAARRARKQQKRLAEAKTYLPLSRSEQMDQSVAGEHLKVLLRSIPLIAEAFLGESRDSSPAGARGGSPTGAAPRNGSTITQPRNSEGGLHEHVRQIV
jgi:hypothetical protein